MYACGHLEEVDARIICIVQTRHRPSLTGTMAYPGSKTGKNGELCLKPCVFPSWCPGCSQTFPGGCGEGCVGVTVYKCGLACRKGTSSPEHCLGRCQSRSGLREGIPGSAVTSLTTDPNRIWNPVTRHPHSSVVPIRVTWLETFDSERCSLAAFPLPGALASRNPSVTAFSIAADIGSNLAPDASGHLVGGVIR